MDENIKLARKRRNLKAIQIPERGNIGFTTLIYRGYNPY